MRFDKHAFKIMYTTKWIAIILIVTNCLASAAPLSNKQKIDLSEIAQKYSSMILLSEKFVSDSKRQSTSMIVFGFGCDEVCKEKERLRVLLNGYDENAKGFGIGERDYYKRNKLFKKRFYL